MSADVLRRAAALMRSRAEAAAPAGVWDGCCASPLHADHVASWHPAVALEVADLLDAIERAARLAGVVADHPEALSIRSRALAVARAYLGESV